MEKKYGIVQIRLSETTKLRLERLANQEGKPLDHYIREILAGCLEGTQEQISVGFPDDRKSGGSGE
ncbi:MAG: hypothetical protein ACLFS4_05995 [Opitutales bacterium]